MIGQNFCWAFMRACLVAGVLPPLAAIDPAAAQAPPPPTIKYFAVSDDQALTYPSTLRTLPDEHTTFIPLPRPTFPRRPPGSAGYLVFASSLISGGTGGTVALLTTDLQTF